MPKHYQAAAMELIDLSEFELFNLPYSALDARLGHYPGEMGHEGADGGTYCADS